MAYIRMWSARTAADALRATLAKLAASRIRPHSLRLLPDTLYFDIQPALSLQVRNNYVFTISNNTIRITCPV